MRDSDLGQPQDLREPPAHPPPTRPHLPVWKPHKACCVSTHHKCVMSANDKRKMFAPKVQKTHLWHLGLPPGGPDPAKSSTRKWERLNLGQIRAFPARFHPAGLYPEKTHKKRPLPDTRGRGPGPVPGLPTPSRASRPPSGPPGPHGGPWGPMGAPWGPHGAPWGPWAPWGPYAALRDCAKRNLRLLFLRGCV